MFAVHQMPNFTSPAVNRKRQVICIFEKFSTCKNGDNCNYLHPTLVCDDQKNCDITLCNKRHPQVCLHDTIFKNCMNDGICRYHHKNNDASNDAIEEKYKDLEDKYEALLANYQRMVKRIESLENDKIQSSRSRSIIDSKRICTRSKSQGDIKRKLNCEITETSVKDKKSKVDNVTLVSDDKNTVSKKDEEKDSNMEVQIDEKRTEASDKCDVASYGVFYKHFEKELQDVKKIVDRKDKMTATRSAIIKDRIRSIGIDEEFEKKTENMVNRSKVFKKKFENMCDKVEKTDFLKLKKVASPEIQKIIDLCKNEQKITK